ncbi:MAG: hypothetical protein L0177_06265 [Chloroflexi bacterium]|nr:hypothetical protein [Chloroflexota bacterium]
MRAIALTLILMLVLLGCEATAGTSGDADEHGICKKQAVWGIYDTDEAVVGARNMGDCTVYSPEIILNSKFRCVIAPTLDPAGSEKDIAAQSMERCVHEDTGEIFSLFRYSVVKCEISTFRPKARHWCADVFLDK